MSLSALHITLYDNAEDNTENVKELKVRVHVMDENIKHSVADELDSLYKIYERFPTLGSAIIREAIEYEVNTVYKSQVIHLQSEISKEYVTESSQLLYLEPQQKLDIISICQSITDDAIEQKEQVVNQMSNELISTTSFSHVHYHYDVSTDNSSVNYYSTTLSSEITSNSEIIYIENSKKKEIISTFTQEGFQRIDASTSTTKELFDLTQLSNEVDMLETVFSQNRINSRHISTMESVHQYTFSNESKELSMDTFHIPEAQKGLSIELSSELFHHLVITTNISNHIHSTIQNIEEGYSTLSSSVSTTYEIQEILEDSELTSENTIVSNNLHLFNQTLLQIGPFWRIKLFNDLLLFECMTYSDSLCKHWEAVEPHIREDFTTNNDLIYAKNHEKYQQLHQLAMNKYFTYYNHIYLTAFTAQYNITCFTYVKEYIVNNVFTQNLYLKNNQNTLEITNIHNDTTDDFNAYINVNLTHGSDEGGTYELYDGNVNLGFEVVYFNAILVAEPHNIYNQPW